MGARIEEVFKVTGVPTHTFVEPSEFGQLKVALRTSGRGVVVEGPSGIGKSTAVTKALETLELDTHLIRRTISSTSSSTTLVTDAGTRISVARRKAVAPERQTPAGPYSAAVKRLRKALRRPWPGRARPPLLNVSGALQSAAERERPL